MNPASLHALIPIIAVGGGCLVALAWIILNPGKGNKRDRQLLKKLEKAYNENEALAERVKNLEYIVTSLDKDILRLHAADLSTDDPSRQIEALKDEIKRLKQGGTENEGISVS